MKQESKAAGELVPNPGNSSEQIYRFTESKPQGWWSPLSPKVIDSPPVHPLLPLHHPHCSDYSCTCNRDTDSTYLSPNRCCLHHGFLAFQQGTLLNSPGRSVGLPGAQTHPAELRFAVLVPTDHMVAAPILLDGDVAFWAFLCTGQRALLAGKAQNPQQSCEVRRVPLAVRDSMSSEMHDLLLPFDHRDPLPSQALKYFQNQNS